MRVEKQPAFVLRTQSYLETSLLVDVFSRDYGRLKLIAKGAKGGRYNKAAELQPFRELKLSWQGKSDLKTLTSVESNQIKLSRPEYLVSGMYLNELLFFLLTEADPHEELYQLYLQTLEYLQEDMALEPVLRKFEFGLLEELGYAIDLTSDIQGEAILVSNFYHYSPDSGLIYTEQGEAGAIPGEAILDLVENGLQSKPALRVAKLLCRSHIDLLLAGRELQSRRWYQSTPDSTKN